jgi:hypothetical protein
MAMLSLGQKLGISTLLVCGLALPLTAQTRPFQGYLLGQTQLSYQDNDRDVIRLGQCPNNKRFNAVKVMAVRGTANIKLLRVRFGNNRSENLSVRSKINQGSETRWIDLDGAKRCITSILVVGDTADYSPRPATIQVYGR